MSAQVPERKYNQISDPDADNIYVNVRINHQAAAGDFATPAFYSVNKNTPFLNNCSNYYCTVTNFAIPLDSIPLTVARVTVNPNDPTDVNYMSSLISITTPQGALPTISNTVTVHLEYIPDNNVPPPTTVPNPDLPTPYYYFIYSYSNILQSFNAAIATAFNAQFSAGPVAAAGAPYLFMNYATGLISLVASNEFITNADLYINNEAQNYLQAFNLFLVAFNTNYLGISLFRWVWYQFNNNCDQYGNNQGASGNSYWIYTQEYYGLQEYTTTRKILILTSTIPINNEMITVNQSNGLQTGEFAQLKILYDFIPPLKNGADARDVQVYDSANYKLMDMQNTGPLSRIDIKLAWEDTNGNVYPLYINVYQAINIKLLFIKKSLRKNYWPELR